MYERTPHGHEIEWGEIVEWDPPRRLRYRWHIATEPRHATDVEIVFHELADSHTRVEIEHGGWDRLGEKGQAWRDSNHAGWDGVLPAFTQRCA
ncbi:MAG: SRPBCC domain-containing protein [Candidatus Dormibacteraceae bacterium]